MSEYSLVIGNKNFSSWSLRAWLMMKITRTPFTEIQVKLRTPESKQEILKYSPSGMVPVLLHHKQPIWDSLAIGETLAELFPEAYLWPTDSHARAHARSISAEMHAGFAALRSKHPMDMTARTPQTPEPDVAVQIERIQQIWRKARSLPGRAEGPFLYGHFTIADAMYAPVVSRFVTYEFPVEDDTWHYMDTIWKTPIMAEWYAGAQAEVA